MSAGAIAALIAAGAFTLLVLLLAIPLLKLGRTLDEATLAIRKANENTAPILSSAHTTLEQVNAQLDDVQGITKNVGSITNNAAALTSVVSSTVGSPLIKLAAFSYGVRKTVQDRREAAVAREAKRRHRASRRGRAD